MDDIVILSNEEEKNTSKSQSRDNSKADTRDFITKLNDYVSSFQKVKTKEKVVLYRLLATMLNAGMSLVKSLSVLENQEKNPVLKNILSDSINKIKQ